MALPLSSPARQPSPAGTRSSHLISRSSSPLPRLNLSSSSASRPADSDGKASNSKDDSTASVSSNAHLPDPLSPIMQPGTPRSASGSSSYFMPSSLPDTPSSSSSSGHQRSSSTTLRVLAAKTLPLSRHRSHPTGSILRSLAVPGRIVRPTFALALILLLLHLFLPSSQSALRKTESSSHSVDGHETYAWSPPQEQGQPAAKGTHHLVWDPKSETFISRPGPPLVGGAAADGTGKGGQGRLYGSQNADTEGHSATSSSDGDADDDVTTHPGSPYATSPQAILLYSSSARFGLTLDALALLTRSPRPVVYRPRSAFDSVEHSSSGASDSLRRREPRALRTALAKEGKRLETERAGASSTMAEMHGDDDEDGDEREAGVTLSAEELKGFVLGSCKDDLPTLDPLLRPLVSHRPVSLSCAHPYDDTQLLPWSLLAPYAKGGYLTLISPSTAQAQALREALAARAIAEREAADGWEFVEVFVVRPFGTGGDPSSLSPAFEASSDAQVGRQLLDGAVQQLVASHASARYGPSRPPKLEPGKPASPVVEHGARRKVKDLRNVVIVIDDGPGVVDQVERYLADMVLEIRADPKFWGYALLKEDDDKTSYDPLRPGTASPGEDEVDDRFTVTLACAPKWLRFLRLSSSDDERPREVVVPHELSAHVVHHVDGADGSGAGGDQEAELGFWKAVIEADLILDLGGGVGQDLVELLSVQTQTPVLTIHSAPHSETYSRPHKSSVPTANPNVLHIPLALHPAEVVRTLRRGAADGVDLGRHWKLREQIVLLIQRGLRWRAPLETGQAGAHPPSSAANSDVLWKKILVRPF